MSPACPPRPAAGHPRREVAGRAVDAFAWEFGVDGPWDVVMEAVVWPPNGIPLDADLDTLRATGASRANPPTDGEGAYLWSVHSLRHRLYIVRDESGGPAVAVSIDTSRALRGTDALRRLVEAVIRASKHDETDWLEWKSTLDLASKEGRFHVARTVIGFANRLPDQARLHCEGVGYLVVGAEPGSCEGVDDIDPADLTQGVGEYLGHQGPAWTPTLLRVGGTTVLVVTVEPPRSGDRIHCLRKQFDQAPEAAIYIRRPGMTDRARAADLDALQNRLLAALPALDLTVGLVESGSIPWLDEAAFAGDVDRWVERERQEQLAPAGEVARRNASAPPIPPSATILALSVLPNDERTFDQYVAQVDQWARSTSEWAAHHFDEAYFNIGAGAFHLQVQNGSDRFLTNVELTLHFEDQGVAVYGDQPDAFPPPARPRPFGDPPPMLLPFDLQTAVTPIGLGRFEGAPTRWTSVLEDDRTVVFHLDELRQGATERSRRFYMLVTDKPQAGVLRCTWRATIQKPESAPNGNIDLQLAGDPMDVAAIISHATRREEAW